MFHTVLCDLLGIRYPILQGAMQGGGARERSGVGGVQDMGKAAIIQDEAGDSVAWRGQPSGRTYR